MRPGFPRPPVSVTQAPGPHRQYECTSAAKVLGPATDWRLCIISGIEVCLGPETRIVLRFLSQSDTESQPNGSSRPESDVSDSTGSERLDAVTNPNRRAIHNCANSCTVARFGCAFKPQICQS